MKEQIEEIFDIITTDCDNKCDDCDFDNCEWCFTRYVSAQLYNAGYRKQSEGEWILKWKSPIPQYEPSEYQCSNCGFTRTVKHKFCPNCGAHMKGGE